MIKQIISDLKNNTAWYRNNATFIFQIPDERTYDTNHVKELLDIIGYEVDCSDTQIIVPHEIYNDLLKTISSSNTHVTGLSDTWSYYNDLTDSDWLFFEKHIEIKLHSKIQPPEIIEQDSHKFLVYIRKTLPQSSVATGLIKQFLHICLNQPSNQLTEKNISHSGTETRQVPNLQKNKILTVDMRPSISRWLLANEAYGHAVPHLTKIRLAKPETIYPYNMVMHFLHELRHLLQYRHDLFQSIPPRKNLSYADFIEFLPAEADAYAYDLIINHTRQPHISEITDIYREQIEKNIISREINVPYRENLSSEQKLASLYRFIEAQTEQKTSLLLINCLLSPSRIKIYHTLKVNAIELNAYTFNQLAKMVDEWKDCYISDMLEKQHFQLNPRFTHEHIHFLETKWKQYKNTYFNFLPHAIFSYETATYIGIEKNIYGDTNPHNLINPFIQYAGITKDTVAELEKSFNNNDLDKILTIYTEIQKKNIVLPHPKIFFQNIPPATHNTNFYMLFLGKMIMNATKSMAQGASLTEVLRNLRYDTNDVFNKMLKKRVIKNKQHQKHYPFSAQQKVNH